ncbi:HAD family hydrolase [Microlunatus speluncae]|uniref:HAD family hydrolase n=1 Tax=Microlunatus speluncae TaxID=2594267 RepID=UPI0012662806|nr:HAD-IA family hydrolase [Microlunatus speluncae]
MARCEAVLFDLFETLVTEFDPDWRPPASPAERLGLPAEAFARVWRARHAARMTRELDFRDVLRESCAAAGVQVDRRRGKIIEDLYAERLAAKARSLTTVDLGILRALDQLRAGGLRIGLVSNCAVEEVAAWSASPLAARFDEVAFSCRVGCAKPDPAIYLRACRGLGVVPDRAAFVGDGGSDELAGATAVGLTAHRARWFLDQWPAERRDRDVQRGQGFPAIMEPAELVAAFTD